MEDIRVEVEAVQDDLSDFDYQSSGYMSDSTDETSSQVEVWEYDEYYDQLEAHYDNMILNLNDDFDEYFLIGDQVFFHPPFPHIAHIPMIPNDMIDDGLPQDDEFYDEAFIDDDGILDADRQEEDHARLPFPLAPVFRFKFI